MPNTSAPAGVRRYAVVFLVAIALASPVAAGPASGRASTAVPNAPAVRIDNFGRVDDALFRGAQPEGRDYDDLKKLGVKTIVNLTSDDADPSEKASAESAGMGYVQIPMTTHTVPTSAQLAQFLSIVNDPANQPVYVHCVGGRHRTGVMTAAYRMTHEGWSGEQAFKEMKQYNFGSDFLHPEFKQFVYGYHPDVRVAANVAATSALGVQPR
jgi:tyrosine-protein phosphatase SIW14